MSKTQTMAQDGKSRLIVEIAQAIRRHVSWYLFLGLTITASALLLLFAYYNTIASAGEGDTTPFTEATFHILLVILTFSGSTLVTLHFSRLHMARGVAEVLVGVINQLVELGRANSDTQNFCAKYMPRDQQDGVVRLLRQQMVTIEAAQEALRRLAGTYDLDQRTQDWSEWLKYINQTNTVSVDDLTVDQASIDALPRMAIGRLSSSE